MKFTPSSSVSSSTNSFSALGCFSGFLSRILCSKSLSTYPSDPNENHKKQQQFMKIETVIDGSATPNVVARLMGLDWMPEIDTKNAQECCNLIARRKSGDFREETEEMQDDRRRPKTSFSLRETPNYFELEDDDFLVLSFENRGGCTKKKGSKFGNQKRDKSRRKQRRNRDEQGKDRVFTNEERLSLQISPHNHLNFDNNVDIRKQSYHLSPLKDMISGIKEEPDGIKSRKKKKKGSYLGESKDEAECNLENSSPVSVLDDSEFISDPEVTTSEEEAKSRGLEFVSGDLACPSNGSSKEHEREANGDEDRNVGLKRKDYKKHENIEMLRRICKLAEAEVNNSNWKYRGMLSAEDLEETGIDFSQHIFDQLVTQLVDQLVGLQCQEF